MNYSLDMTKGVFLRGTGLLRCLKRSSVMSGIITGPYFRAYFNFPDALAIGTMVAVLEVGAFSACPSLWSTTPYSHHCAQLLPLPQAV